MKNKKNKILWPWFFFTLGFIIEMFAFLISHGDTIVWVDRLVASDFVEIKKGIEILSDWEKNFHPGDEGFPQLSSFIVKDLSREKQKYFKTTGYDSPKEIVQRMKTFPFYLHAHTSGSAPYGEYKRQLTIDFFENPNEHHGELQFSDLVEGVQRDYKYRYFVFGGIIFLFGFCLQLRAFIKKSTKH